MDLDGSHRMDWFFNQYVYGTDLPSYHFDSQVHGKRGRHQPVFQIDAIGRSRHNFRMLVPHLS